MEGTDIEEWAKVPDGGGDDADVGGDVSGGEEAGIEGGSGTEESTDALRGPDTEKRTFGALFPRFLERSGCCDAALPMVAWAVLGLGVWS